MSTSKKDGLSVAYISKRLRQVLVYVVMWIPAGSSMKVRISSPSYGTIQYIDSLRANGGINLELSVLVETPAEYISFGAGQSVCLHVNGSGITSYVNCMAITKAHGFLVPSATWQAGQSWFHIELCDGEAINDRLASAPALLHIEDSNLQQIQFPAKTTTGKITLILTLTIDDAHRALVLLGSLREHECHASNHNTYELFVIVPDEHIFATRALETSDKCAVIRIVEESSLLDGIIKETWHAYALQMALKLLVAQYVTTSHYITLDSDIVLVGMINLTKLLPGGRGVFEEEPRNIHPHWWQSSAALLGLPEDAFPNARFGVTPAILSTAGSAITTTLIRDRFKDVDWQEVWLR